MRRYTLLLLIVLIAMTSQVQATLGEFDIGECVQIRTVLNTTAVNISSVSIPAPNGTVVYLDEPMTKNSKTFNYTFCQTQTIGFYVYDYYDQEGNTYVNDFYIGKQINTGESVVYVILLIANAFFLVFFLYGAIKIPYKNEIEVTELEMYVTQITKTKYVKLLCIWLGAWSFVWLFSILTGLTNNYISFVPLREMMSSVYVMLQIILGYSLTVFMAFFLIIVIWKDILFSKRIKKFGKAFMREIS